MQPLLIYFGKLNKEGSFDTSANVVWDVHGELSNLNI